MYLSVTMRIAVGVLFIVHTIYAFTSTTNTTAATTKATNANITTPVVLDVNNTNLQLPDQTVSRKLEWTFIEETIDTDEWYTYYEKKTEVPVNFTSTKMDQEDYLRYTDICPNTSTKTYSYDNCLLINTPDCSGVQDRQPNRRKWGEAKLCINRAPFSKSNETLFYVAAMKCVPVWENCDKCLCGVIDKETPYGRCYINPSRGQEPSDDRWEYGFCDDLDTVRISPAKSDSMTFKVFDGPIETIDRTDLAGKNEKCPLGERGCVMPPTDGRITFPCGACKTGQCGYSKNQWTCKSKSWPYNGKTIPAENSLDVREECPIGTSGCPYPDQGGLVPASCSACKSKVCGYKDKRGWECRKDCWPDCNKEQPPPEPEPPSNDDEGNDDEVPYGSVEKGSDCPTYQMGCIPPRDKSAKKVLFECHACKTGLCGFSGQRGYKCRLPCWPNC
mmetsp:Transcript_19697/g.24129  ORF Transcript_19697/g.24129 Transcript_19697/m.24129 type:complete len:445 (+) Transcript_19697:98-1432(+)